MLFLWTPKTPFYRAQEFRVCVLPMLSFVKSVQSVVKSSSLSLCWSALNVGFFEVLELASGELKSHIFNIRFLIPHLLC